MNKHYLQPVLVGGLFTGVLSLLPGVNLGNCCCLWVIGGGMVAAYLLQNDMPAPITIGDGALVGLGAGVVGAALFAVLVVPVFALTTSLQSHLFWPAAGYGGWPDVGGVFEGDGARGVSLFVAVATGLVFLFVVGGVFGMIGGMIGAAFFRSPDRPAPPPSPPPPPPLVPPPGA